MSDDCPVNGFPWVDIEIANPAIKSFVCEFDEGHFKSQK
jgi:hypothetical protein